MRLFPDSVDAIAAEQAHFAGTMPLLFLDDKFDEVADVFLGRGTVSTEFGANQVIIVRNQEAKRSLPKQLAGALVMMTQLLGVALCFTLAASVNQGI